jgi:hypothetical protein
MFAWFQRSTHVLSAWREGAARLVAVPKMSTPTAAQSADAVRRPISAC